MFLVRISVILVGFLFSSVAFGSGGTKVDNLGFTIAPPAGWKLKNKVRGMTALISGPAASPKGKKRSDRFVPTIAVKRSGNPQAITKKSVKKYKKMIWQHLKSQSATSFKWVGTEFVTTDHNKPALVMRSSFKIKGLPLEQMYLAVAGEEASYLLIYTAAPGAAKAEDRLSMAWASMLSANPQGVTLQKSFFAKHFLWIAALLLTAGFVIGFLYLRNKSANFESASHGRDDYDSDIDLTSMGVSTVHSHYTISQVTI